MWPRAWDSLQGLSRILWGIPTWQVCPLTSTILVATNEEVPDPARATTKGVYSQRLTAPLLISTSPRSKTYRDLMNRGLWNPVRHKIQPLLMQLSITLYREDSSQVGIWYSSATRTMKWRGGLLRKREMLMLSLDSSTTCWWDNLETSPSLLTISKILWWTTRTWIYPGSWTSRGHTMIATLQAALRNCIRVALRWPLSGRLEVVVLALAGW